MCVKGLESDMQRGGLCHNGESLTGFGVATKGPYLHLKFRLVFVVCESEMSGKSSAVVLSRGTGKSTLPHTTPFCSRRSMVKFSNQVSALLLRKHSRYNAGPTLAHGSFRLAHLDNPSSLISSPSGLSASIPALSLRPIPTNDHTMLAKIRAAVTLERKEATSYSDLDR
jgi:hypothetical protein